MTEKIRVRWILLPVTLMKLLETLEPHVIDQGCFMTGEWGENFPGQ